MNFRKILSGSLPPSLRLYLKAITAKRASSRFRSSASNRHSDLKLLVVDDHVPTPDKDAGSARMWLILTSLTRLGQVVFMSLSDFRHPTNERLLREQGIQIVDWRDYRGLLKQVNFDVAILSRPDVAAALLPAIRRLSRRTRVVFDTVDLNFVRLRREYSINSNTKVRQSAERYLRMERRLARSCDQVWCVTSDDAEILRAEAPETRFELIPTIHPLQNRVKGFAERSGLMFIGNFLHRPNEDAVRYFITEVFPHVRKRCPQITVTIVGDNVPGEIVTLADSDVRITGYVADVDSFFQSARVFIAPLRFGSGMKGKIGQSLSFGLPVVTTLVGAEGMQLEHDKQVLIAETPEDYAHAVCTLHEDAGLWRKLSDNGYDHVRKHFTPEVVGRQIKRAISNLLDTNKTNPPEAT